MDVYLDSVGADVYFGRNKAGLNERDQKRPGVLSRREDLPVGISKKGSAFLDPKTHALAAERFPRWADQGRSVYGEQEIRAHRLRWWQLLGDAKDLLGLGARGARRDPGRTPAFGELQGHLQRLSGQYQSRHSRCRVSRASSRGDTNSATPKSLRLTAEVTDALRVA